MLSLLGAVIGALVAGSICRWLFSEAVVGGFRQKLSLVDFVGSGRRWILSEAVFGDLVGSNSEMLIELL